jgi:hypothetical protein
MRELMTKYLPNLFIYPKPIINVRPYPEFDSLTPIDVQT